MDGERLDATELISSAMTFRGNLGSMPAEAARGDEVYQLSRTFWLGRQFAGQEKRQEANYGNWNF